MPHFPDTRWPYTGRRTDVLRPDGNMVSSLSLSRRRYIAPNAGCFSPNGEFVDIFYRHLTIMRISPNLEAPTKILVFANAFTYRPRCPYVHKVNQILNNCGIDGRFEWNRNCVRFFTPRPRQPLHWPTTFNLFSGDLENSGNLAIEFDSSGDYVQVQYDVGMPQHSLHVTLARHLGGEISLRSVASYLRPLLMKHPIAGPLRKLP